MSMFLSFFSYSVYEYIHVYSITHCTVFTNVGIHRIPNSETDLPLLAEL